MILHLGAEVQDPRIYPARSLAFGTRFVEAISTTAGGRITADLTRISEIEPEA